MKNKKNGYIQNSQEGKILHACLFAPSFSFFHNLMYSSKQWNNIKENVTEMLWKKGIPVEVAQIIIEFAVGK